MRIIARASESPKVPAGTSGQSRVGLMGAMLDDLTMDEAAQQIAAVVEGKTFCYAVTPNINHVVKLRRDEEFRQAYQGARFCFADGVPLLWVAALGGTPLKGRLNGTDLFEKLCEVAEAQGYKIFLLGGNPGAAAESARVLLNRHPRLLIAGWECPGHGFDKDSRECEALQKKIAATGADILFIGLGAPKQELWMQRYGAGTGASFAIGIGVSFSFVAGEISRAPLWMQRRGLEWLWRLFHEPKRLWRRYLVDAVWFLALLCRWLLAKETGREAAVNRFPSSPQAGVRL